MQIGSRAVAAYPRTVKPRDNLERRAVARVGASLALVVLGIVSLACSGGDGQAAPSTRPPASAPVVVADAIGRYDRDRLRPPSDVAREFVFLTFQTRWGLSTDSAECATERLVESVGGPERLGDITLGELTGDENNDAERDAALACANPDDTARMPTRDLAPDLDVQRLRALQIELLSRSAQARGLTGDEASCLADRTWGALSDDDVLALTKGGEPAQALAERLGGTEQLEDCVSSSRIEKLARTVAPDVESEIQATSTTTVDG